MSTEAAIGTVMFVLHEMGVAIGTQTVVASVVFLVTNFVARDFFAGRRIQPGKPHFQVLRHEIVHALITLASGAFTGIALKWCISSEYIFLDKSMPCDHGNNSVVGNDEASCGFAEYVQFVGRILLEVFGYFVVFDTYFYWGHRLLHTKPLYFLHKPHHISVTPNVVAAFSFNPLEGFAFGSFLIVSQLVWTRVGGGFHLYSFGLAAFLQGFQSILIHSGFEFFPVWVFKHKVTAAFLTPTFHDRHHECV